MSTDTHPPPADQTGGSPAGQRPAPAALLADQPQVVTPQQLRRAVARFATGVVVLTVGGDHIHGMTANAFSSVSLDPPLVLCCVSHAAVMHNAITSTGSFAVSVLGADQETGARYFADQARPLGSRQFRDVSWDPGPRTGSPLLAGSLAWLECELADVFDAGDHSIFLGRVLSSAQATGRSGLIFFDGAYRQVVPAEA